jgi:hypothetical protein
MPPESSRSSCESHGKIAHSLATKACIGITTQLKILILHLILLSSGCLTQSKIEHCAVDAKSGPTGSISCALCNNGFFLTLSKSCSKCDKDCRLCEYKSNQCTGCFLSKFVSNSTCLSCPRNCDFCNGANNCIRCEVGFFVLADNTGCGQCPPNCASCWSSETCGECKSGFTLVTKKDQQICIRAGLSSMIYTLIGGTVIIASLYCLTNWWKNRQNRLIEEGEKLINEPSPYPNPMMEGHNTHRILDGMDLTLDFRNADGGLTHGVELADFNVSRIEGRVLEDVTIDEIQINEQLSRSLGDTSNMGQGPKQFSKKNMPIQMEGIGRSATDKVFLPGVGPTGSHSHFTPLSDNHIPAAGHFKDGTGDSVSNDRIPNLNSRQVDEYVEEPTL